MAEGLAALRLCSPVDVASAESVIEFEPIDGLDRRSRGNASSGNEVADRQYPDIDDARDGRRSARQIA